MDWSFDVHMTHSLKDRVIQEEFDEIFMQHCLQTSPEATGQIFGYERLQSSSDCQSSEQVLLDSSEKIDLVRHGLQNAFDELYEQYSCGLKSSANPVPTICWDNSTNGQHAQDVKDFVIAKDQSDCLEVLNIAERESSQGPKNVRRSEQKVLKKNVDTSLCSRLPDSKSASKRKCLSSSRKSLLSKTSREAKADSKSHCGVPTKKGLFAVKKVHLPHPPQSRGVTKHTLAITKKHSKRKCWKAGKKKLPKTMVPNLSSKDEFHLSQVGLFSASVSASVHSKRIAGDHVLRTLNPSASAQYHAGGVWEQITFDKH